MNNINYNYALTNRWGVRPPSPAKEAKKTLIAQTCFKIVADDRHMEKKTQKWEMLGLTLTISDWTINDL